jgi:hypothetical protein
MKKMKGFLRGGSDSRQPKIKLSRLSQRDSASDKSYDTGSYTGSSYSEYSTGSSSWNSTLGSMDSRLSYRSGRTFLGSLYGSQIFDLNKINNELNRRKIEDVERQKIQRILRGNDYQRITFELVSTKAFQYTVMGCVVLNIFLLLMPTMPIHMSINSVFRRFIVGTDIMDSIFLAVYCLEMILKIYVFRSAVIPL